MIKKIVTCFVTSFLLLSGFGQDFIVSTPKQRLLNSLENLVEICVNGYSFESLYVTNSNGTIRKTKRGFIIHPEKPGNTNLKIYSINDTDTIFIGSKFLDVHPLAKYSEVHFDGAWRGTVSKELLMVQVGLNAQLINQEISLRYEILSYRLVILRGDSLIYTREFYSDKFGQEIRDTFKQTLSGDEIYFLNVLVKGIGSENTMKLNDISLTVE